VVPRCPARGCVVLCWVAAQRRLSPKQLARATRCISSCGERGLHSHRGASADASLYRSRGLPRVHLRCHRKARLADPTRPGSSSPSCDPKTRPRADFAVPKLVPYSGTCFGPASSCPGGGKCKLSIKKHNRKSCFGALDVRARGPKTGAAIWHQFRARVLATLCQIFHHLWSCFLASAGSRPAARTCPHPLCPRHARQQLRSRPPAIREAPPRRQAATVALPQLEIMRLAAVRGSGDSRAGDATCPSRARDVCNSGPACHTG